MTEPTACPHERLDYLDPLQGRGWLCPACGQSGPTMISIGYERPNGFNVQAKCVCGSGYLWYAPAMGAMIADYLAQHADCKPGATDD